MKEQTIKEPAEETIGQTKCTELLMKVGDSNVKLRFLEEPRDLNFSDIKSMMLTGYSDASLR